MRQGFTLFEIVLVMVVIVILAALAAPLAMQGLHTDTRVTAGADMVRARWADCRFHSMDEGRPYMFSIVPNSGKFKLEPYDGISQPGQAVAGNAAANSDNPGVIVEDKLPQDVRFGTADRPVDPESEEATDSNYILLAIFDPDGTAREDVTVSFGAKGTLNVTIQLTAATGTANMVNAPKHEDGK